jgi:redox-sensitive bicupin YhaK (pirin superfamily)
MFDSKSERKVHQILDTKKTMVGTLPVLRAFAGDHTDFVSPYVFFDEFGPVNLAPKNKPLRVDAHPHAGIIPTTYFLSGSGHHRDSLNYDFQIGKGDFMMFTSGKGAIHMEETGKKLYDDGGIYHGFQIWLNIPSKYKFIDPSTKVHHEKEIPFIKTNSYTARIVLGELYGKKSAIELYSPAFYYHFTMKPNSKIEIPTDPLHNAFIYLIKGKLELEGRKFLKAGQVALYERGESLLKLFSSEGSEFLVQGGKPLNETVYAYGPFVMNTEDEINKCIHAYNSGKMGDPDVVNGK